MKKINTIADLSLNFAIKKESFKNFEKSLIEEHGETSDLLKNWERKIINGTYKIIVPLMSGDPLECFTESFEITAKNTKLGKFIHKICLSIDKLLEKHEDWHMFLEGFRKIDEKTYEAFLGS